MILFNCLDLTLPPPPLPVFAALLGGIILFNRLDLTICKDEQWREAKVRQAVTTVMQTTESIVEGACVYVCVCACTLGQGSRVTGQGSRVRSHGSRVRGQGGWGGVHAIFLGRFYFRREGWCDHGRG